VDETFFRNEILQSNTNLFHIDVRLYCNANEEKLSVKRVIRFDPVIHNQN